MVKYKVLDLFAGGGGFSTGFLQAKYQENEFDISKSLDIDKEACKTLANHLSEKRVVNGDITDNRIKEQIFLECEDVDVIIGGPPCQTFSLAGPARSGKQEVREALKSDPRNVLYKHFFEIVRILKPRFVVFENVEGITSKKIGNIEISEKQQLAIEAICEELKNIGYCTKVKGEESHYRVLNSADFGVPQQRKRVVIIANKRGIENIYPKNTHGDTLKPYETVGNVISGLPVVLPQINSSNIEGLKNIDIILDNLPICIGAFVNSINFISKKYSCREEIQSKEFIELLNFINDYFDSKIVNRKRQKLKVLEAFIEGYNSRLKSLYKSEKIDSKLTAHESRKHNIRDLVIFSMMESGSNSSQFMNPSADLYNEILDNLYPYDKTKHKDTYVKHSFDKVSNTILAHMQKDGLKFIHPDQPRTYTPYEAALIQSFPTKYDFSGGKNSQFRQIGNAVPPLLAKRIGEVILEALVEVDSRGERR
ncbi:DNA cytosine methyltransferase [Bacillus mycoides]|uniref:DNA cytosine methyltransferase n=1 Tax=Bacillus mycoides TaxID=1405 RepID=UPI00292E7873|nr:DNA cytosine methyltransferase [Bacillus mycoides]WOA64438.1 DNA cytosine methyltransferase [Bacillus mycoides]